MNTLVAPAPDLGNLTVVPAENGHGFEVLSPSAGNTHFPWTDNWNYISGHGVIFRDSKHVEKVRVRNDSGNVGIGTGNPGAKLTAVPDKNGCGVEVLSPTAGNTHFPWIENWNYISGKGIVFRSATMKEKMRMDLSTGNLGIGTTSPTAKLDVNGAMKCKSIQIGNTVIGEKELKVLKTFAAGNLDVDLWNSKQQEYLYAADFAPYDNDLRRVFTWRRRSRVSKGRWKLRFPG